VTATKAQEIILLLTILHGANLLAFLPIQENMDDVINVLLGSALCNGGTLGLRLIKSLIRLIGRKCPEIKSLAMLLRKGIVLP
jgi:hypothetical protein